MFCHIFLFMCDMKQLDNSKTKISTDTRTARLYYEHTFYFVKLSTCSTRHKTYSKTNIKNISLKQFHREWYCGFFLLNIKFCYILLLGQKNDVSFALIYSIAVITQVAIDNSGKIKLAGHSAGWFKSNFLFTKCKMFTPNIFFLTKDKT